jgi:hypothetical protein
LYGSRTHYVTKYNTWSLTITEQHRPRGTKKKVLREILDRTVFWGQLRGEEFGEDDTGTEQFSEDDIWTEEFPENYRGMKRSLRTILDRTVFSRQCLDRTVF